MEIVKEVIDNATALLRVNVQPEDYRENVNAALKEYARKVQLPGFRPGKVPLSVVKNMVGKAIVLDELNKTLYSRVNEWVREQNIEIIGEPLPKPMDDINLDPDANATYEFLYEVGLVPAISLNLKTADFPEELSITVDEAFVDKEVGLAQKRHGKMDNPEVSQAGDILFGFLTEPEAETYDFGKRLRKAFVLNPDRNNLSPALLAKMVGVKKDEVLTLTMADLTRSEAEVREMWEEHPEEGAHFHLSPDQVQEVMKREFQYEVKNVNHITPAELNQELFDKVLGPEKATTVEEFRAALRADIERHFAREAKTWFRNKVMASLIAGNPVELSTPFLRRWLIASREKVTDANVDEMMPGYLRDLRWSLIVNEIIKGNPGIKVTSEEVEARIRTLILEEYGGMGGNEEAVEGLVKRFMEDNDFMSRISMQELDEKVFAHIVAVVAPQHREVTATEFEKMI